MRLGADLTVLCIWFLASLVSFHAHMLMDGRTIDLARLRSRFYAIIGLILALHHLSSIKVWPVSGKILHVANN